MGDLKRTVPRWVLWVVRFAVREMTGRRETESAVSTWETHITCMCLSVTLEDSDSVCALGSIDVQRDDIHVRDLGIPIWIDL